MRHRGLRLAAAPALCLLASLLPWPAEAQQGRELLEQRCVLRLPGMEEVRADTSQVFRTVGDRRLAFDLFHPGKAAGAPTGRPPVVVFVNGVDGAEIPLRRWGIYRSWARLVAVSGMAAVLHDARAPNALEDLDSLLTYLRAHSARLGIDADNVAIWACSANLRTGSRYAFDAAHPWVRCGVFYYGAIDTSAYRPDLPLLVARAGLDNPFLNASLDEFIRRTVSRNGALTLINLPNGRHAFDLFDDDETSRDAVRSTLAFLKANLDPSMRRARAVRAEGTRTVRLHASRDWEGTIAAADEWVAKDARSGHAFHLSGDACYQLKRYREAGERYDKAASQRWWPGFMYYNAACSWALAGVKDQALADLERSFATGFSPNREAARNDPDLSSLRDDPRFRRLVDTNSE